MWAFLFILSYPGGIILNINKTLEFNVILEELSKLALSNSAKEKLLLLEPFLSESECKTKMRETTEAKDILEKIGSPPLVAMDNLNKNLILCEKGSMLLPEQLTTVSQFIISCRRMKSYLKRAETLEIPIAYFGNSIIDLTLINEEIDISIRNGIVDNAATTTLRDIRRKIENTNESIKIKLENILRTKKEWFADTYVAKRNGHFVLPVKKEYKNQVSGIVIDNSGSGSTYFIEPTQVRKLVDELNILVIDEDNEIRKILYTLTALVCDYIKELRINIDCMEILDFIFAKAKLSINMKAIHVDVSTKRKIVIKNGRHPLLNKQECVPLDFEIGGLVNGVIITGPNTGGKTVALKTVGLLSLMAQCGLHVPVSEGSEFCMNINVLCDIGDGQSITENLSTFSAHLINIIEILKNTTNESLVLLDELGSGTDPAEGMGLAISILDELKSRECLFVATTHYPEIKDYAKNEEKLINARMDFNRDTLKPLFKLQIGEAGESCALYIAKRLGFPNHMLDRAYKEAYGEKTIFKKEIPIIEFLGDDKKPILQINKIQKEKTEKINLPKVEKFKIGDSVKVYPQKLIGIIYKLENEKGELIVQIKGKKQMVNHKRIKILAQASDMYPEDYDFSIIFDSVENRKASNKMNKSHNPDLVIIHED